MSWQQEHVCVGESCGSWKEMSCLFHAKVKREIIFCKTSLKLNLKIRMHLFCLNYSNTKADMNKTWWWFCFPERFELIQRELCASMEDLTICTKSHMISASNYLFSVPGRVQRLKYLFVISHHNFKFFKNEYNCHAVLLFQGLLCCAQNKDYRITQDTSLLFFWMGESAMPNMAE